MNLTLGEYLRVIRMRQNLSLRELSMRCGVSYSTICRIEDDKNAEFWNVAKVASALSVSLDQIVAQSAPASKR